MRQKERVEKVLQLRTSIMVRNTSAIWSMRMPGSF